MATRTWTGAAGDGNFDNTSNWSAANVPVTGDSVIVSASATSGMSTNLNRSADGAGAGLNIVSFTIQPGFRYSIGSSTAPLRLSADKFTDNGAGALYFETDTGSAALPTDRLIIDKSNPAFPVYISKSADSDITRVEIVRGQNVNFIDSTVTGSGGTWPLVWIVPRYADQEVSVSLTGTSDYTAIVLGGGTLSADLNGTVAELIMSGGVYEFLSTTTTALYQMGGTVIHKGEASNYAISTYYAIAGYLDSNETPGGKLISTLYRSPQWDMEYNPELVVSSTTYIGG